MIYRDIYGYMVGKNYIARARGISIYIYIYMVYDAMMYTHIYIYMYVGHVVFPIFCWDINVPRRG